MEANHLVYYIDKEVFYKSIDPLEENYLEFLDMSESYMGWLLTLSSEEFEEVLVRMTTPPGTIVNGEKVRSLALPICELVHKEIFEIVESELHLRQATLVTYTRMVFAIKEGLMSYEVGPTDGEWKVSVTEAGVRAYNALSLVKRADETHKDILRVVTEQTKQDGES
jgi:hypothetical protein